jgi:folate-binding Fe-S cluster repair protein YgfZ
MPTPASVRALVRATPTIVRLQNRALISVSGSQAAEFLNGLLSSTVTNQPYRSFYSAFLHAQVSLVRVFSPPEIEVVVKLGSGHV